MMTMDTTEPLHYFSLNKMAGLIKSKEISPVALTRYMIDRIDTLDSKLNSYALVMRDQALAAARLAENEIQQGKYRGQLHGIPIAVKDLCYTKGVSTKGGLKVLADFVPEYDATVISKLKSAGAILLGKLALTEGAVGGYHKEFSIPINPWAENLWTGSSSSGSGVATAAGLSFGALGSDTGGSIRFPAMANGIVGLKPTYGRVSRYGILPLAESLDHVGPLTRTVADAGTLLEAISGQDKNDPSSLPNNPLKLLEQLGNDLKGLRIGYDADYATNKVDQALAASIEEALKQLAHLGAEIVPTRMPDVSEVQDNWRIICSYQAAKAHAANYPSRIKEYGSFFRDFLMDGSGISDKSYHKAMQERAKFNKKFLQMLTLNDAFVCPGGGVPCEVPSGLLYQGRKEIRAGLKEYTYFQFTIPANFAGVPSLSLPCGISSSGIPYTFQLIGPRLSEGLLCSIGHQYEQSTKWHQLHPDI